MKKRNPPRLITNLAFVGLLLSPAVLSAEIEEIVISASPHVKTQEEVIGSINILDGSELQRAASATLGETLQNQIGVHSSSFGPGVGVPVIRGQSGKRVEILQNNTVIADVSDTSADHAVATEAFLAERIEILRGPATLRYGPGATGGVVNVINHLIHFDAFEGVEGGVEARYTDNNEEQVVVGRLDAGTGKFMVHLDGVVRDSENVEIPGVANLEADDPDETTVGFIGNSDREADSFNLGLAWVEGDFSAGFSIGALSSDYGVPAGAHGHEEEGHDDEEEDEHDEEEGEEEEGEEEEESVRIELEQTLYQLKLKWANLSGMFDFANVDLSYTEYEHVELEIEGEEVEPGTEFDVESLDLRAELGHGSENFGIGGWQGAFGIQYGDRDFQSEGLEAFIPLSTEGPVTTENIGLFVIEETQLDFGYEPSTFEFGLRVDQQSVDANSISSIEHSSLNASASLLMPVSENSRLSFIFSKTERAPVIEELLSDGEHAATGTYEIGDASLNTEEAVNLELTWAYQSQGESGLNFRTSVYHNDYSNYIYQFDTELLLNHDLEEAGASGLAACTTADQFDDVGELAGAIECFTYLQDGASFAGIEAELGWSLTDNQSVRFWGDSVRARLDDGGDVPLIPTARLGASWAFAQGNWDAELSLVHAFEQDRPGENQETTDSYSKLNAVLGYGEDNWSVFLRGSNLTDEDIRNAASITREQAPEAGRALTLGARYEF